MSDKDILVLKTGEIQSILENQENKVVGAVAEAYILHGKAQSSLPHSLFLRFPNNDRNRIIALPGFLGGESPMTGMKWVSSFPGNTDHGLPRASAVIILNSSATGRPEVVMEGSIISAVRTAASAALAAFTLQDGKETASAGLIGCGLINFQILRFLRTKFPELTSVSLFDLDANRAESYQSRCAEAYPNIAFSVAPTSDALFASSPLISFATTAGTPHIPNLSACQPGSTILHVSLRDLTAETILASDNIVDDLDHVCRERTSIHLAAQASGNRDFVRCSLADILDQKAPARVNSEAISIFSPFGLGVLDLAVAQFVCETAKANGMGSEIQSFLP